MIMNTAKYTYINTAKNKIQKVWTMFISGEDLVWYYISTKRYNTVKYKTIDEIQDLQYMIVFENKTQLMYYLKEDIKNRKYPLNATHVEVSQGYVTKEKGKIWFDTINYKRYTLKEATKWH